MTPRVRKLALTAHVTTSVGWLGAVEWGWFRHYWVAVKFLMTTIATALLLLHLQPTSRLASVAAQTALSSTDLRGLRIQLVADAGAALFVLFVTTTLSVYKPWGRIPYSPGPTTRTAWGR